MQYYKVYKTYIQFHTEQETQQAQKNEKTRFPNESVKNADFYKPELIKIMTTHK